MHQQLIPQFYVIGSIMALFMVFDSRSTVRVRRMGIVLFFLAWVAQFYSSFYSFVLLGLPFGAALAWAFFVPGWRKAVLRVVREHYLCILLSVGLALVLMWPLLSIYLWRTEQFGYIKQPIVRPKAYIWFLTDANNLLYGWIRSGPFRYLRGGQFAQGLGFATALAGCAGLLLFRRWNCIRVILAGFLLTVLATTYLTDSIGFWHYLRDIIPGAKAIRTVCRIGMIQLIPVAIGVGLLLTWASRNRFRPILPLVMVVCLLEQVNFGSSTLSKRAIQEEVEQLARQVDTGTTAFLLLPTERRSDLAELANSVALVARTPTLNLRYLNRRLLSGNVDEDSLVRYLQWLGYKGTENVQLIEVRPRSTEH